MNKLEKMIYYAREALVVPGISGEALPFVPNDNKSLAATALKNLSDFGYTLDEHGTQLLSTASKEEITDWYFSTVQLLKEVTGGEHEYHPFYPNFPEQVMSLPDTERWLDQLMHYLTGARPQEENRKQNIPSLEEHSLKVIKAIHSEDVLPLSREIFQNVLNSKETPSESTMRNIIDPFIKEESNWTEFATQVTNRDLLAYLYVRAIENDLSTKPLPALVTKDYLRIAKTYNALRLLDDDEQVNFLDINDIQIAKLPRKLRSFIAYGLEGQKNLEEDIARDKNAWKHVFKLMHAGSFQNCERLQNVVYKVRNNKHLETFYSKVERAFLDGDYKKALALYSSRPGEMIKNFNRLLNFRVKRDELKDFETALHNTCEKVFKQVRPEDLLSFTQYLTGRGREDYMNVHYVKGEFIDPHPNEANNPIPKEIVQEYKNLAFEALISQISATEKYKGKIYIDPQMYRIPLPSNTRESSDSMGTYPKGARLPVEKNQDGSAKNVRLFTWWTNRPDGRNVDLDLSAELFSREKDSGRLDNKQSISYHASYKAHGCTHSGDLTDGGTYNGRGAAEYVDLNLQKLKEVGIDYVQVFINAFRGGNFGEFPCEAGWMEREELDRSQQFDIKAVKQHCNLSGNYMGITSVILDVNNEEVIWMDSPNFKIKACENSKTTLSSADILLDRYASGDRLSMGELVEMVAKKSHSELVEDIKDADFAFTWDNRDVSEKQVNITCKDQDVWLKDFMSPSENAEWTKEMEKQIDQTQERLDELTETSILEAMRVAHIQNEPDIEEKILSESLSVDQEFNCDTEINEEDFEL